VTLSITCGRNVHDDVVMVLRGSLSYATALRLRRTISAAVTTGPRPSRLFVDLDGVRSVDATGVGTLVVANRICQQRGVELVVRNPSAVLRPILGLPAGQRLPGDARRLNRRTGPDLVETGARTG
jgi:anti-sigma B factor antagonist